MRWRAACTQGRFMLCIAPLLSGREGISRHVSKLGHALDAAFFRAGSRRSGAGRRARRRRFAAARSGVAAVIFLEPTRGGSTVFGNGISPAQVFNCGSGSREQERSYPRCTPAARHFPCAADGAIQVARSLALAHPLAKQGKHAVPASGKAWRSDAAVEHPLGESRGCYAGLVGPPVRIAVARRGLFPQPLRSAGECPGEARGCPARYQHEIAGLSDAPRELAPSGPQRSNAGRNCPASNEAASDHWQPQ